MSLKAERLRGKGERGEGLIFLCFCFCVFCVSCFASASAPMPAVRVTGRLFPPSFLFACLACLFHHRRRRLFRVPSVCTRERERERERERKKEMKKNRRICTCVCVHAFSGRNIPSESPRNQSRQELLRGLSSIGPASSDYRFDLGCLIVFAFFLSPFLAVVVVVVCCLFRYFCSCCCLLLQALIFVTRVMCKKRRFGEGGG